jgi:hypothetical protein
MPILFNPSDADDDPIMQKFEDCLHDRLIRVSNENADRTLFHQVRASLIETARWADGSSSSLSQKNSRGYLRFGIHDAADEVVPKKLLDGAATTTAGAKLSMEALGYPSYVSYLARKADAEEMRVVCVAWLDIRMDIRREWWRDESSRTKFKKASWVFFQRMRWVRVDDVPFSELWRRVRAKTGLELDWTWLTLDTPGYASGCANALSDRPEQLGSASCQRPRASSLDLVRLTPIPLITHT